MAPKPLTPLVRNQWIGFLKSEAGRLWLDGKRSEAKALVEKTSEPLTLDPALMVEAVSRHNAQAAVLAHLEAEIDFALKTLRSPEAL